MIGAEIRAWFGPETRIGVEPEFAHGGMDAQALRFEGDVGGRTRGIDQHIRSRTRPGDADGAIAEPFSGRYPGVEALLRAAVLTGELARLSRAAIHLGELNETNVVAVCGR